MTVTTQMQRWQGMAILKYLVILFTGFAATGASANGYHPMRFNHITLDDGLSQSTVLSVLQDSKGMIWMGTENGLNRYNGYEFEVFRHERGNPDSLSSDFVFDIEQDASGNLWLATNGGGLVKRDARSGNFSALRHDSADAGSISGNVIRSLLLDSDGTLWLGFRGAGLDRLNPETGDIKHYGLAGDAEGANTIYTVFEDSKGNVWAGGDHGLTRIDGKTGDVFTYTHDAAKEASVSVHPVRAIAEDAEGRIWVGSYGGGLSRLRDDRSGFDHFRHDPERQTSLSSDRVSTLFVDDSKRLWAGTTRGLNLVNIDSGAVARFGHENTDSSSLGADDVMTVYQDRSGLIWVGTKTRGVDTWNPRTWGLGFEPAKEVTVDEERQPNVTAFASDGDILWIGTFGDGLNALDRETGEITRYRNAPDSKYLIGDDRVMSVLRDRSGNVWAGTMTGGITLIDPEAGTSEVFRHDPANARSLGANGVMTVYEDRDGRIWVGTFGGGISIYEPATKSFTRIAADAAKPGSLSSNRVTSIAEDPSGRIWVGTEGGGLNLYDTNTGEFHHFRHDPDNPQTLAADTVYAINVDADGTVWIGTHGGGLDRVVGDAAKPAGIRFENISQQDGLTNNVVYGVQFDDAGWLWLSTNYGISGYNPETGEIRNLHRRDGLQSEEFNFGAHYRSPEGELFFGGHNGYNAFQPEALPVNSTVPLIALTGFFNSNDPKGWGLPDDEEGVELGWKDDNVAFEFAALDFTAPQSNRYMYRLEGFDEEWIDLGNRRRVTYTDLDDGQYLLRVKAANSDGVWNEVGYTIPVTVKPAPWDTWYAYLVYVALAIQFAAFLWLGHRRKIAREEEYSRRLEQEVSVRTDKLIQQNQQLNDLNKALEESSLSDPLTGLRNRRFVFEEVSRDIEGIRRKLEMERDGTTAFDRSELVFMMIDMDNFKPINDTYGHAAGDEVLLQFRDLLLSVCRKSDFVIRWGGDEFVVIAKQAGAAESEALAERIRSTVANHSFVLADSQVVHTSCSIGFAAYPLFRSTVDGSGLDQIMSLADNLMYEAKKSRNAWVGMMGPNEASTSADVDHDAIESTSVLFRARHTGNLARHGAVNNKDHGLPRIGRAAS